MSRTPTIADTIRVAPGSNASYVGSHRHEGIVSLTEPRPRRGFCCPRASRTSRRRSCISWARPFRPSSKAACSPTNRASFSTSGSRVRAGDAPGRGHHGIRRSRGRAGRGTAPRPRLPRVARPGSLPARAAQADSARQVVGQACNPFVIGAGCTKNRSGAAQPGSRQAREPDVCSTAS